MPATHVRRWGVLQLIPIAFGVVTLLVAVGVLIAGPGRVWHRALGVCAALGVVLATFGVIENLSLAQCREVGAPLGIAPRPQPDFIGPCIELWLMALASELLVFNVVGLVLIIASLTSRRTR